MADFEMNSSDSKSENNSDAELQDAFAKCDLKPGLNVEVKQEQPVVNNTDCLKQKLNEVKQKWMERQAQKRANPVTGNAKMNKAFAAEDDPISNDFKREMTFHRQAQSAVNDGNACLDNLAIATKRRDAEMAKTKHSNLMADKVEIDEQMNIVCKPGGPTRAEIIEQLRERLRQMEPSEFEIEYYNTSDLAFEKLWNDMYE